SRQRAIALYTPDSYWHLSTEMGSTSMASMSDGTSKSSREPRPAHGEAERTLAKDGSAAARADQAAHPDYDAASTTGSPPAASPPHPWRKRLLWAVAVVGLVFGGYLLVPVVETALN